MNPPKDILCTALAGLSLGRTGMGRGACKRSLRGFRDFGFLGLCGFRVQGFLGFCGLGFRVQGFWGLGLRVLWVLVLGICGYG